MQTEKRARTARAASATIFALSGLLALSSAALGAPPAPQVDLTATCVNDSLGGGLWGPEINFPGFVSYKGKWVSFRYTATVDTHAPKSLTVSRWNSKDLYPGSATFSQSASPATTASLEVQILSRGAPVGDPVDVPVGPCIEV